MTGDPKEDLAEALAGTGPDAALAALARSIGWAVTSLSTEIGDDDLLALRCVMGLDDAQAELTKLLDLVPAIVRIASPGPLVQERIAARQAELDRQLAELAVSRSALAQAGDVERDLSHALSERSALQAQLDMLERRQQISGQLPQLQACLRKLRQNIDETTSGPVEQVAQGLIQAVRDLADLTEEQRALIGPELSDRASATISAGRALEAERQQLDELKAEEAARLAQARELQREYQEILPGLKLHRQADQELADAIAGGAAASSGSSLDSVRSILAEVTDQLARADAALRSPLDEHGKAYADALAIKNWTT